MMNSEMEGEIPLLEDDPSNGEIKSIEINLNVIKTFFVNTINLYEGLVKTNCKSCSIIESEEFITLHKNLCEFENIFKVFEVAFNKSLLAVIVRKSEEELMKKPKETNSSANGERKFPCFVNSCSMTYSSDEGVKIHFIKNHCKRGDMFDPVEEDVESSTAIDFSTVKRDENDRYLCETCEYATNDRSNFKVHIKRHNGERKYRCFCEKCFFTRDQLMVHFVRLHMKEVDWKLASTDIRILRKTIRRMINRDTCHLFSNDEFPDSDSDWNGPVDEGVCELNHFITEALTQNERHGPAPEISRDQQEASDLIDADSEPVNSFNMSINLKDNDFFVDSVTFKSEGITEDIDELLVKNPGDNITATMAPSTTKDKVMKKNIPQRARKYKCPHKFCEQDFFTHKNLVIHLKASHDPSNQILCPEEGCQARFKSKALLAQHQKRHRVQYSCSLCTYKTHLAALMTRHNRQHAGEPLFHECPICHEKFEYLGALSSHRRKVHNEQDPLVCQLENCGKKFKTIIGLKKHGREYHMKMKAEIPCEWPECNAVFSNKTSMTNHMRIHTDERPYQCEWQDCGKWFRLKETLRRHVKLHQGYKPYVCPCDSCDNSFFTKRSMKSHYEKTHLRNPASSSKILPKMEVEEEEIDMEESM